MVCKDASGESSREGAPHGRKEKCQKTVKPSPLDCKGKKKLADQEFIPPFVKRMNQLTLGTRRMPEFLGQKDAGHHPVQKPQNRNGLRDRRIQKATNLVNRQGFRGMKMPKRKVLVIPSYILDLMKEQLQNRTFSPNRQEGDQIDPR
ncbi:hypothetical protein SUGI_0761720 [Cryptomeria japonica]|nr:hypothetical protein SUGI_0761720 [Cryptomeria japonica]